MVGISRKHPLDITSFCGDTDGWPDSLVVMLVAFVYMERMKKQHDLVTYREVLAFSRGEQVDRDTLEGRREREMNPWVKGTRNAVQIIIGAIAGGLVGVGIGMLAKMLS